MAERVMVFIDGSNFYHGCKENNVKAPWDMVALGRDLAGEGRKLIRVYYYNARCRRQDVGEERAKAEDKFYDSLRRLDYLTVRLGRLEGQKGAVKQKGVDVLLVQDALTLAMNNAFDTAVVVTNDGDFGPVIQELKARGKQVEVAFLGGLSRPSYHLREHCDRYVDLLQGHSKHFRAEKV